MGSLGPLELILIFLAILLIFGAKRIPEIARGLGKGIKEFKSATREITNEFNVDDSSSNRIQPPEQPRQGAPAPRTRSSEEAEPARKSGDASS
ncbi:MAG: twin-arginine translocase TatA/TatE family subunit [Rhodothermales bacterium]|nr:twin-arginine translocase TatA/TatE family subunit [Rhodothermales bacterium]